ncbi:MAG TPA: energy transducer TonB [Pyrinomonadaceae bacterium]|nr:energy transducer TonB [Pyrinomonadaceae bacterium]
MRYLSATFIAILFAASLTCESFAQDTKDSPVKTATSAAGAAKDESKGDVDRAVAELIKQGEIVIKTEDEKFDKPQDQNLSGVIVGRVLKLVTPAYPEMARSSRASGDVVVRVLIDKEGKVVAAQMVDGQPVFRAASIRAAKASRFAPTLAEGKPVNVIGRVAYSFMAP